MIPRNDKGYTLKLKDLGISLPKGLTIQQKKLIRLMLENEQTGEINTKQELLRRCGYSDESRPNKILEAPKLKTALESINTKLETVANRTLDALSDADYKKLSPDKTAQVFDKVMKHKALIQGTSTANVAMVIKWQD